MGFKMKITIPKKTWKEYFIVSIICSFGALLIHIIYNNQPNFKIAIMWLPSVWLGVFILMLIFGILTGENE